MAGSEIKTEEELLNTYLKLLTALCTVECRNLNVRKRENAESRSNAGSVIRRSDFGHSDRSNVL